MRHRVVRRVLFGVVVLTLWHLATVPWGFRMLQLAAFVAPGAIIGAGAGWAYSVADEPSHRGQTVTRSVVLGALILPPVLAALLALSGTAHPSGLPVLFVFGAWVTLCVSVAAAGVKLLVTSAGSPNRRSLMLSGWRSMATRARARWPARRDRRRRAHCDRAKVQTDFADDPYGGRRSAVSRSSAP